VPGDLTEPAVSRWHGGPKLAPIDPRRDATASLHFGWIRQTRANKRLAVESERHEAQKYWRLDELVTATTLAEPLSLSRQPIWRNR
jgi:hypothetical protein